MNYLRNWVLAAYRAEHERRRNPTEDILDAFDKTLFDKYEEELQKQGEGITLDDFNRSILVYFATCSTAATASTRVKHAFEFFRNVNPIP